MFGAIGAPAPSGGADPNIQRLVAEREQCRKGHDWARADTIREQLRGMGIELFDREKEWRAQDGRRGPITEHTQPCALSDAEIVALIEQREQCRKSKDFATGDMIREQVGGGW